MATKNAPGENLNIRTVTPPDPKKDRLQIMVYGEPGIGKTVLAGSSPNALIIRPSTDGTESLGEHGYAPDEVVADDWQVMEDVYEFAAGGDHDYEWFWLDSISLFQEMGLDSIMRDLLVEKPHRDEFTPGVENYGENMNRISKWVRRMRALPVNFGITAHVMRTEDHDGEVHYMPTVQGKNMTEKISAYMGIVGALRMVETTEGPRRVLHLQPHGKWYAKDRYTLNDKGLIVDPTIPKITAAIAAKNKSKPKADADGVKKSAPAKRRPRKRPSS